MEEDLQRKGRPQGTTRQVSSAEGEGGEAYHTGRLAGMAYSCQMLAVSAVPAASLFLGLPELRSQDSLVLM